MTGGGNWTWRAKPTDPFGMTVSIRRAARWDPYPAVAPATGICY